MNSFESDLRAAQAVTKPTKQQREQADELARIDRELRPLLIAADRGSRDKAARARALLRHRANIAASLAEVGGKPWELRLSHGYGGLNGQD